MNIFPPFAVVWVIANLSLHLKCKTNYHADMKKFFRQAVYFLLLTLMSNAVGLAFNQEAVADVLFEEQRILVANADHSADQHDDASCIEHQHSCNHWCHALGHFMGLLGQTAFVVPELIDGPMHSLQTTLLSYSFNDLFRPPRATLA